MFIQRISFSIILGSLISFTYLGATTLLERSPFIPDTFSPPNSPPQNSPQNQPVNPSSYEFQGMYKLGEKYYFSIKDKRSNASSWVNLNSNSGDYLVTKFNKDNSSLTINLEGKEIDLEMISPTHSPIPVASAGTGLKPSSTTIKKTSNGKSIRRRVVRPTRQTQTSSRRTTITPP